MQVKLDNYEKDIDDNFLNQESISNAKVQINDFIQSAIKHLKTKRPVTIRIASNDLEAIKIDTHKDHTDLIKLTDDIQVRMVPPKMEYLMATVSKNQIDIVMDVIRDSISEIIQGKEVFSAQDHTKEELEEFLNSLNSGQFQNVRQFFETMPALRHDIEYTCNKCNKTEKQTLQGLASFFASA